ncbi:MBOAT family protein [bacterium]|nr:MBOAT family protein [bacterium]
MLFNSIDFAIFLPVAFILYWFVFGKNLRVQNAFILFVSYIFYGWWDWKFLSLIAFSTIVDFVVGLNIGKSDSIAKRKVLLWISILVNLGFLGFFKYYNFFLDSFVDAFNLFGQSISYSGLNIVLPVGISFYTFQTMSYSIDVYRKKLEPTKDFVAFGAYVSFFPQLVAGPIERAVNLLPQFSKKREFDYEIAVKGLKQIVWGFFKKVVIADNCAYYVNDIFQNYDSYGGLILLLGAVLFAFQIYGDFSGYSDIAIGVSRLFGFDLMKNFAFPYFSRDIAEFWRRWHISLSTWFRDYLYIPIGGSKGGMAMKVRNTFVIFLVSGFWHGANWTFVAWGAINALYFLPLLLLKKNRSNLEVVAENSTLPTLKEFASVLITFFLTCVAWVFFRAESVSKALSYLKQMFTDFSISSNLEIPAFIFIILALFIIVEWTGRRGAFALDKPLFNVSGLDKAFYLIVCVSTYLFANFDSKYEFIYFQF